MSSPIKTDLHRARADAKYRSRRINNLQSIIQDYPADPEYLTERFELMHLYYMDLVLALEHKQDTRATAQRTGDLERSVKQLFERIEAIDATLDEVEEAIPSVGRHPLEGIGHSLPEAMMKSPPYVPGVPPEQEDKPRMPHTSADNMLGRHTIEDVLHLVEIREPRMSEDKLKELEAMLHELNTRTRRHAEEELNTPRTSLEGMEYIYNVNPYTEPATVSVQFRTEAERNQAAKKLNRTFGTEINDDTQEVTLSEVCDAPEGSPQLEVQATEELFNRMRGALKTAGFICHQQESQAKHSPPTGPDPTMNELTLLYALTASAITLSLFFAYRWRLERIDREASDEQYNTLLESATLTHALRRGLTHRVSSYAVSKRLDDLERVKCRTRPLIKRRMNAMLDELIQHMLHEGAITATVEKRPGEDTTRIELQCRALTGEQLPRRIRDDIHSRLRIATASHLTPDHISADTQPYRLEEYLSRQSHEPTTP